MRYCCKISISLLSIFIIIHFEVIFLIIDRQALMCVYWYIKQQIFIAIIILSVETRSYTVFACVWTTMQNQLWSSCGSCSREPAKHVSKLVSFYWVYISFLTFTVFKITEDYFLHVWLIVNKIFVVELLCLNNLFLNFEHLFFCYILTFKT